MRRTLAVVLVSLWALIGLPGTAHAGGPTSVLITQPGSGPATALYYTSTEYADLERLVVTDGTPLGSAPAGSPEYNLTWLIHDVQPWRLDTVRVGKDGTVYVATARTDGDGGLDFGQEPRWETALESTSLAAFLRKALTATSSTPTSALSGQLPVSTGPEPAAAEPVTRWFSLTGWRWMVPGVLVGLLASLVAVRRRPEDGPRQVLLDREPGRAGA
jgi:hypothetical protein